MDNDLYVYASTHDIDWFAADREGNLGYFTTGGRGALPHSIAMSIDAMSEVLTFILNSLEELPDYEISRDALSKAEVLASDQIAVRRYMNDFAAMAKRGLYAFDAYLWPEGGNPYFRVAVPVEPRGLSDLSSEIAGVFEQTKFDVSFASVDDLNVPDFRDDRFPRQGGLSK